MGWCELRGLGMAIMGVEYDSRRIPFLLVMNCIKECFTYHLINLRLDIS